MRAKDVAFVADVLTNEAEHAAPGEVPGLLAATGALRVAIVERQPEADVTALEAVEDALIAAVASDLALALGEAYTPEGVAIWLRNWDEADADKRRRMEAGVLAAWSGRS